MSAALPETGSTAEIMDRLGAAAVAARPALAAAGRAQKDHALLAAGRRCARASP